MIYNLKTETEVNKAKVRFEYLVSKGCRIELTEKRNKRSLSQNNFLHLCLAQYCIFYGDTLEYVKQEVWKSQICPDIFKTEIVNRVTGEVREGLRSSKDLDTKELTIAIDRLRDNASRELGVYISTPEDLVWRDEINNLIEENKQYI